MESLRTTALQRELTRIENEAREHSLAAMGAADALEAAEQLCVLINAGLDADKGVEPTVIYFGCGDARVAIYTNGRAVEVLQRAAEAELERRNPVAWAEKYMDITFAGFDNVHVIVENNALAHYFAGLAIEQAAA